jgi:ABC-type Zn uptake system ZnuABC Zn-binding protein ZnuA
MFSRLTLGRAAFVALLAALVPVIGCGGGGADWPADKPGPKVVVSFPPLYCFAANVGGPEVAVKSAMTSQGPHHFDPKPSDARLLSRADLFVINGLSLDERIADKMTAAASNSRLKLINLGERFNENELEAGCECEEEEDGHNHKHDHSHATDPHVWLAPDMAVRQVEGIRDALKEADPSRAAGYDQRAAEYVAKIQQLKADGVAQLKDKKDRKIVTFHGSLAYFAKEFGIDIVDVIQKTPGKEPTGKTLEKLVQSCVEHKVRVIAVEPQYSGQASARRVLEELKRRGVADAVLVEIDPLETAQPTELNPRWYEEKMRENLSQLAGALK